MVNVSLFNDNVKTLKRNDCNLLGVDNDIDAIKLWLNNYDKHTNKLYRSVIERFYSWLQLTNSKDLRSLKIEDIQNYRSFLSSPFDSWCGKALPRKHHNWRPFIKKLSQTSINLHISIIKSLLSYLHTAGYMPYSFQKLIKVQYRYNEINSSDEYLSQNSYVRLRRNIIKFYGKDAIRYTFVLDLFFYTGLRRAEAAACTLGNVFVRNGKFWIKVIGKGNKYGEIPFLPSLFQEWLKYCDYWSINKPTAQASTNLPLIIKNKSLTGYSDSGLYYLIKRLSTKFYKAELTPHDFRHAYATALCDNGLDIRIVQANLRHSNINTTMRYLHIQQNKRWEETCSKFTNRNCE